MLKNIALLIPLLSFVTFPIFAAEHRVPVSTVEELAQAIRDANERPATDRTFIHAIEWVMVPPDTDLPIIESNVVIGATFHGLDDSGPARLLKIGRNGRLEFSGRVIDFVISSSGVDGFIENDGELHLRGDFKLVRNYLSCHRFGCTGVDTPVIYNAPSARLYMNRFIFSEEGYRHVVSNPKVVMLRNHGHATITQSQVYLPNYNWQTPIHNAGRMLLANVSMVNHPGRSTSNLYPAVETAEGATTESVNSVYGGFSGDWCSSTSSLGYNVSDSDECGWEEEGDLVDTSTGLIWRDATWIAPPVSGQKALVPTRVSAAVDSADESWCGVSGLFARDGDGDGEARCDRGAVETTPIGLLDDLGGINGLYFNPEADGHYIHVTQTDFAAVIVWNTFDAEGNHVWVYGTGQLVDGSTVVAETWINVNAGSFNADSNPPSEAVYWGTIEMDLRSCTDGAVAYNSVLPGFGAGSFPIKRLGYVSQIGCVD